MQTDVREIASAPVLLPLSVLGLFAVKAAIVAATFRAGGFNWGRAVEGGLLLGQGGEFAFIVIGYALGVGLLAPEVGRFMVLVVALSLFATPIAARAGTMFAEWWEGRHAAAAQAAPANTAPMRGHIVIAGYGRVGQLLAQILTEQGIRFAALESDAKIAAGAHAAGQPVYFGDASRPELLQKLHAEDAAAIVLTMDHPSAALHAARAIRRHCPRLPLYARSRDEKHARELKDAGVDVVIPETLEAGLQLSGNVLQALGLPESAATRLVQGERERRIALIQGGKSA
jgi:CPA2 family monovalent cation:H+ antiporter-2